MNLSTSAIVWGLIFGTFGTAYFVFGRKRRSIVPVLCGLALMVFPYFVANTILLVAIGVILMAIPFFVQT
jgi:hypothetical protein